MTDHLEVPLVATGDWIDAAWLNQYLRDNIAAIFQGLATGGDLPYAVDANTVGALAKVTGGLLYGGASAPAYLPIQNPYRILMSNGTNPFWASLIQLRQGGDANNWQSGGTTTRTPADSYLQSGVIDITTNSSGIGSVAITYPAAFAQKPMILATVGGNTGGRVVLTFSDDLVSGCTFHVFKIDLGVVTIQVNWLAIGTAY